VVLVGAQLLVLEVQAACLATVAALTAVLAVLVEAAVTWLPETAATQLHLQVVQVETAVTLLSTVLVELRALNVLKQAAKVKTEQNQKKNNF